MKKIIALLLAMIMVMSLAIVVSADETYADEATVTLSKIYKETNGTDTSKNPAEEFKVTIVPVSVTEGAVNVTAANMPVPTVDTVSYTLGEATAEGVKKDFTITLPVRATAAEREAFSLLTGENVPTTATEKYMGVGIYTYKITEDAGDTAGVDYYAEDMFLVVTVIEDGQDQLRVATVHVESPYATDADDKIDEFTNVYSAGDLKITKTVAGNMGDRDQYFDITVTLTGDAKKTYETIAITGSTYEGNVDSVTLGENNTATVNLKIKHGDEITFENIPYDVTYTVTEAAFDKYEQEVDIEDNAVVDSALEEVDITNTKNADVDTGVFMDSVPFVVMAVVAVLGVVAITAKKRVQE